MAVTLKFDTADMTRALQKLKARAKPAIARALNRAATTTRAVMARAVSTDIGLPVGTTKAAMTITQAAPERLVSMVEARGARIPLIRWVRGTGGRRGITARLPGGAGHYPHAFIATTRSGHRGVFQRTGRARLPIYELKGPSIVHVFSRHRDEGLVAGEAALRKNLQSEFKFVLSQ